MTPQTSSAADRIPQWTFADRIRKARLTAGMSQAEFAAAISKTPSAYAQWEAGNNNPRQVVEVAKRIQVLTGIAATWILGVDEPEGTVPPSGGTSATAV